VSHEIILFFMSVYVHYRYVARFVTAISICGARHDVFGIFMNCYHLCFPEWRYSDMRVRFG
jgi:hypothetical protein